MDDSGRCGFDKKAEILRAAKPVQGFKGKNRPTRFW